MSDKKNLSRRKFIGASAAAMTFLYVPGVGKVRASNPSLFTGKDDYTGRLCYNENPLGPSPLAMQAMRDSVNMSHRYPDWFNQELESRIAEEFGLSASNICAGAGATEVIRLIADAFLSTGDEIITATPTYSQMATEATGNGASVVNVPLDNNHVIDLNSIHDAIGANTKMISLVNPNNPVATIFDKNDMQDFMDQLPGGIVVVVDEAYHHYVQSPDYESCVRLVEEGYPVVVVRTFSKIYGLAGARIGYSVGRQPFTDLIASSQNFGMISNISQAAAIAALDDSEHISNTLTLNDSAKQILIDGFNDMNLDYIPSETNYMMFDTGTNASTIASQLAERGYQVRTGWGMPQHIRVSTGTIEEMNGLIQALREILELGIDDDIWVPVEFGLSSVYPNPFNSRCFIWFSVHNRDKVKITVYDTAGRRVRSLMNRSLNPGRHRIEWDGRNYNGERVASGTYIIRLTQGEMAESTKVTLLK
ncbi:MAG: aminotransferase class I/II-fold pyridoxal phosphate-dependent enzyme [candidate division Zixibacteria bacterium]|nr:aminotransferase class I/II-fold pyridoxal phosphate-dependent enzyme [candidate division Zixibacteria bacterium]